MRRIVVAGVGAFWLLLLLAGVASAYGGIDVKVDKWSAPDGHAYVGVTATGKWAPPADNGAPVKTPFYSVWQDQGSPSAYCHTYWVTVYRTADGSIVNPDSVVTMTLCGPEPVIGVSPTGFGDLSLYLAVGVDPTTAPARTERTVSAELTKGWRNFVDDAIAAYIRPESLRVQSWTVDFGDGSRRTFAGDGTDRLSTTHAYDAGTFDVVVTAHVTGEAYGAFFSPDGTPFERVVPFELDISNRATGVSALPIEYVAPVVAPGGSPSGALPGGRAIAADAAGHAAIFWPRGLPCALYVRALVETEGFMRSGGVRIGGATTRLLRYRYLGATNDASDPSPPGTYDAGTAIRIQWNTPLPDRGSYPIRVALTVETTYEDGTVRTFDVAGTIAATVVYSSISQ